MAIAYDTATDGGSTGSGTTLTWAHTCTGSNLILFVGVTGDTTNDTVTGVTYNSVSMKKITSVDPNDRWQSLWYLLGPATGANNVVVTSSSSVFLAGISASYTGVNQFAQPDSFNSGSVSPGTSLTVSTTPIDTGCWTVLSSKWSGSITAGAGSTVRVANGGGGGSGWSDSNGIVTAGASYGMTITEGASANGLGIICSFVPVSTYEFDIDTDGTLLTNLKYYARLNASSNDFSTNAKSGTDTLVTYSSAAGKVNNGADISASAGKIKLTGVGTYSYTDSFSLCAWVKVPSLPAAETRLIALPTTNNGHLDMYISVGASAGGSYLQAKMQRHNQATDATSSTTALTTAYSFIVFTYNGTTGTLYLNNTSIGTLTASAITSATASEDDALMLDANEYQTSSSMNIYCDEVGFWNKVLSAQERTDLYNGGTGQTMVQVVAPTATGNFFMVF